MENFNELIGSERFMDNFFREEERMEENKIGMHRPNQ